MSFYNVAKGVVGAFYKVFFRVSITGLENIPENETFIICPNHKSNFDPPLIGFLLPFRARFMAKAELFKFKPLAKLLSAFGAYPIKRGKSDIGALKTSIKILKDGERLVIFPEGKRSKTDHLCRGKSGAVLIAIKAGVNILPVGIQGDYKLFKKVTINVGELISLEKYFDKKLDTEELREITNTEIMPAIANLAGVKVYEDRDC